MLRKRRPARANVRRRLRNPRIGRMLISPPNVHTFKRSVYTASALSVTTANVYSAFSFNLNAVPNSSEFTSLFDQYRVDYIKIKILPRGSSAEAGTNNNVGKIFSVIDYDDDTVPTSIDQLMQYPNVKTTRTTSDHTRSFRPQFASSVYGSAVLTGYGARRGWLDCESSTVPHYGMKIAIQGTAGAQVFDVLIEYILSFKGVR